MRLVLEERLCEVSFERGVGFVGGLVSGAKGSLGGWACSCSRACFLFRYDMRAEGLGLEVLGSGVLKFSFVTDLNKHAVLCRAYTELSIFLYQSHFSCVIDHLNNYSLMSISPLANRFLILDTRLYFQKLYVST